jgi:phage gpG-like protein
MKKAILYAVDKQREEAVIGPAEHLTGKVGGAHEHGGRHKKQRYPKRPFMGPALEAVADQIPDQFRGLVGPSI